MLGPGCGRAALLSPPFLWSRLWLWRKTGFCWPWSMPLGSCHDGEAGGPGDGEERYKAEGGETGMIRSATLRGDVEVWVGGQQWPHPAPASTSPQTGFVTQGTGVGLEERNREEICAVGFALRLVGRPDVSSAHF